MKFPSSFLDFILVFGAVACGVVVFFAAVFFFKDFQRDLRYINMEIQRNEGAEREHWKKERKKLWLSLIPFYKD